MQNGNAPVTYDVSYPESLSRMLALVKLFLGWAYVGIPHGIILTFLAIGSWVTTFFAFVSILFTGRYPEGIFNFNEKYHRWNGRVSAYMSFMTDQYPPFTGDAMPDSPVEVQIQRQESYSRPLALAKFFFGLIYVGIPHGIILGLYGFVVMFAIIIAPFAILFTGRYPEGLFNLIVGYNRWSLRVYAYMSFLTDQYPPFNGQP